MTLAKTMATYYDERAPEYDEIYVDGRIGPRLEESDLYKAEAMSLGQIVRSEARGHVIDAPCGTGYWIRHYGSGIDDIVLIDQAAGMLQQARQAVHKCHLEDRSRFIRANLMQLPLVRREFDCAVIGFFLSHLENGALDSFIASLNEKVVCQRLIVLDSVWSIRRRQTREKVGQQTRQLRDGRRFEIYKRYFTSEDLEQLASKHDMKAEVLHEGEVYLAAVFKRNGRSV